MSHIDRATPRLWTESGDEKIIHVASVVPVAPVDKSYAYAIPEDLLERIELGHRVMAPFGRNDSLREAFVLNLSQRPWTSTLKTLDSLVDSQSWLSADLIELGQWIARYYGTPLGRTLKAMVPVAARDQSGFQRVRLIWLVKSLDDIREEAPRLGPKQRALLEALARSEERAVADQVCKPLGISTSTLREVIKKGWVDEVIEKRPQQAPDFDEPIDEPEFELNDMQLSACRMLSESMEAGEFEVLLIYGVSGSGKTEVYIDAMKRAIRTGKQVILLVPEIALTTQLVHRFASRFTDVAVLHSGLTAVQRSLTWNAIRTGEKRVIIGTRSAVFAPCRDLGLIVIDEEQDSSYKNQQSPRFHARDAAIKRAQMLGIPIALGSATPALETWHNCATKAHYTRVHLSRRVAGLSMPEVKVVDMREESGHRPGYHLLSRALETQLAATLERKEQAVLLLNRRGYASALFCPRCKRRVVCSNCQASMVLHRDSGAVLCHHCYTRMPVPQNCPDPSCSTKLIRFGIGTERVEEEVLRKFPQARLKRVDSDTMENVGKYETVIRAFENRLIDIIVGTQMIAKGLDFPFVSLVGVISADTALLMPDFRANEATFQLVTQVAGRAGRGQTGGMVVVQTLMSDQPSLKAAMHHDYDAFAERELKSRRELRMPPFCRLTRWVLSDPVESRLQEQSEVFAKTVRDAIGTLGLEQADVLGPFPSPLERLRQRYRYDVLLRTKDANDRFRLLDHLRLVVKLKAKVQRTIVDVDPTSML